MKIGIFVYSQTGHTLSVAEKLGEHLGSLGHEVSIEEIKIVDQTGGSKGPPTQPQLLYEPNPEGHDALIFGSPVQAFSLAAPMGLYLSRLTGLKGKKIYCFLTQQLKHAWMGGNRAAGQMKKLCTSKGGEVKQTGIVHWSSPEREQQIQELISSFKF